MTLWTVRVFAQPRFYCARVQHLSARTRVAASVVLIVLVALLTLASVIAVWMRALVLNTDSYVRAVGPLIEKPALRDEVAHEVVDELYAHVDVTRLLNDSLPKKARVLAPTLAQGVHDTAIQLASSALSTSAVRRVWEEANRVAHRQLVHILKGQGTILTTDRGEVAVDLRPIAAEVRSALHKHGVAIFDSVSIPALDRKFVLFRSRDLARAQRATSSLDALGIWLPVLTLVAVGGAVGLSIHRRRTLGHVFLVVASVMVILTIGIAISRSYYLDRVGSSFPRAAAAVPFDGLLRALRMWVRILFVASLAGWFATWFAGSRELVAREHEIRVALSVQVRSHGRLLAGTGVAVAALALVVWDQPSPRAVFGVLLALVLWEGALRVLAREPATS
jgi:hypothetical protein